MKKIISLMSLMFILVACSKNNSETQDILYPVQFEVNNIMTTTSNMGISEATTSSTGDSALNKLGFLYYLLFDEAGKYLKQIKQLSTAANFGVISDQLKTGKYTVVLTGSTEDLFIPINLPLSTTKLKASAGGGDIFFNKSEIIVTADGLNKKFLLKRIVGYLELKSTSAIPSNMSKISLFVVNEAPYFLCGAENVDLSTIEKSNISKVVTPLNRSNFTIGKYVLNDQQALSLQVSAYDATNVLIQSKTIEIAKIDRSKKVTVSANMTDLMSVGIGLDLDDEWKVDTTYIPFNLY